MKANKTKTYRRNGRGTTHSAKFVEGIFCGNRKGFGFLEMGDNDIFIPPHSTSSALHGDTVRVRLHGGTGRVEKIVQRANSSLVGILYKGAQHGYVRPDDRRYPDILIPQKALGGAKHREKVVAELVEYLDHGRVEGRITERLGMEGDDGVDVLSIIRAHRLREDFPADALAEAERAPQEVRPSDLEGREDFTKIVTITIDGEDAKDLDDAVSVRRTDNGYELGVYIADVTHYVLAGTAIDREAAQRTTSVYFPNSVLPMLPKQLSNGICSLNPNVNRLVLAAILRLDSKGNTIEMRLSEGVIKTSYRMTYTDCNLILGGSKEKAEQFAPIVSTLKDMQALAKLLENQRTKRGSIDFDLAEAKIEVDEGGRAIGVEAYERGVSNRIIEEFMLAANEAVAQYAAKKKLPFVYRVHEQPDPEKVLRLSGFLDAVGAKHQSLEGASSKQLQQMLNSIKNKDYYGAVSKVVLRTMQKARYATENLGHYGLAADFYCHFTSPIRRYPDLAIHRILKHTIKHGEKLPPEFKTFVSEAAKNSTAGEKNADDAEREVDDLKKAEYMQGFIGEEFDAIISGVTDFGLFAELPNTVEGLIRLTELDGDFYFDEQSYSLVGRRGKGAKLRYRLGDKITVIVGGVNMGERRVEFLPKIEGKKL